MLNLVSVFLIVFWFIVPTFSQAAPLRITPSELFKHLQEHPDTILLDVRTAEAYATAHLPSAFHFPVSLTYRDFQQDGRLVSPQKMQQKLQQLGLNDHSRVIVYDQGGLMDAARVFWALEVYGLTQVKILDRGFNGWIADNRPTEQSLPTPTPSHYIVQVKYQYLASKLTTRLATLNPNELIIDARPEAAYLGQNSQAKRAGHIPRAINIPASHNLQTQAGEPTQHQTLLAQQALQQLYRALPKDKKIITYCTLGRISALNYLVLRELNYDVANYDASWKEWANDFSLPIETPQIRKDSKE